MKQRNFVRELSGTHLSKAYRKCTQKQMIFAYLWGSGTDATRCNGSIYPHHRAYETCHRDYSNMYMTVNIRTQHLIVYIKTSASARFFSPASFEVSPLTPSFSESVITGTQLIVYEPTGRLVEAPPFILVCVLKT